MDRLVKVATPATAATVVVPERVPPGPLLMATVTLEVSVVTVLPDASCTVTTGWVAKRAVLAAPTGWVVTASLAAAPAEMAKLEETAWVNTPSVAARVKVAMPATAATVVVPERVPPGPLLMARVTLEVAPVRLPPASRTRTVGDG